MLSIEKIKKGINTVAVEYPLKKVELFGSYAEGTNKEESDIDLLVEFVAPAVSLLVLNGLKYKLEEILDVEVDIIHGPLKEDAMISIGKVVPVYES